MVVALVAIPAVRALWLTVRWFRKGDRRFAAAGVAPRGDGLGAPARAVTGVGPGARGSRVAGSAGRPVRALLEHEVPAVERERRLARHELADRLAGDAVTPARRESCTLVAWRNASMSVRVARSVVSSSRSRESWLTQAETSADGGRRSRSSSRRRAVDGRLLVPALLDRREDLRRRRRCGGDARRHPGGCAAPRRWRGPAARSRRRRGRAARSGWLVGGGLLLPPGCDAPHDRAGPALHLPGLLDAPPGLERVAATPVAEPERLALVERPQQPAAFAPAARSGGGGSRGGGRRRRRRR